MNKANNKEVNSGENLIDEFFRFYHEFANKHGKDKTVLLMQVGSFHEAYQTDDEGFPLSKLSDVLNVIVSKRNKSVAETSRKNPYMLGFPSPTLPKHLKTLVNAGYTVAVIDQVTPPPNPKRRVTGIYSPGTYVEEINTADANNLMLVYLEAVSKNAVCMGTVIVDVTTGSITCRECIPDETDCKKALDDLVALAGEYNPSEVIVVHDLDDKQESETMSYLELKARRIYHINQAPGGKDTRKPSFQAQVFTQAYEINSIVDTFTYLGIETCNYVRVALCLLINYIHDFNPDLVQKLDIPLFLEDNKHLLLGNDAITSLNLLPTGLFDILDFTCTPMGRRLLKERIAHPFVQEHDINKRYACVAQLIKTPITDGFKGVIDIERLVRRMRLGSIHPHEMAAIVNSLDKCMIIMNDVCLQRLPMAESELVSKLVTFLTHMRAVFDFAALTKYPINEITGNIFREGVHPHIDKMQADIVACQNLLEDTCSKLNDGLRAMGVSGDGGNALIKVECNERDGHYFLVTKKRCTFLKTLVSSGVTPINPKDVEYVDLPKANLVKVKWREADIASDKLAKLMERMRNVCKEAYTKEVHNLSELHGFNLRLVCKHIAELDYLNSGARCAVQRHYCKPEIKDAYEGKSYFQAVDLRHAIIEAIRKDAAYIPTSLSLGTRGSGEPLQDGVLLFGLNSAGKSSLQKSIGLAIICAQMGYYVPAKQFTYTPYKYLFTRIGGNDNIFRGLSSFALEMTELRAILKRSTRNTLVLADEVCKGTEHESSLIIVMAMIEMLAKAEASFITATHLHDIINLPRLKKLANVKQYHIHIGYDEKSNELVYDRTLREGSGASFYGLHVARFVIDDPEFLEIARQVKSEVKPEPLVGKRSKYSDKVYMTECEVCGYRPQRDGIPLETHHVAFQKDFTNGINNAQFHLQKDHASNLVVLCSSCHDKIDTGALVISNIVSTSKGRKVTYAVRE